MLNIGKVTLIYTSICNFRCRHCFWGNHAKAGKMSVALLTAILSACAVHRIPSICFSGGEPMLFFDEWKETIKIRRNDFQKIGICSNGFWGDTEENASRYLAELSESGVNFLELSFDNFHAEFIDIASIRNIIQAAKNYNIEVQIVVCTVDTEYLAIVAKLSRFLPVDNITIQHVGGYGRAVDIAAELDNISETKICPQFLRQPCIDYKGYVYYCCGAYIADGEQSEYLFGNFENNIFNKLSAQNKLHHRLQEQWLSNREQDNAFTSLCAYCKSCLHFCKERLRQG